MFEKEKGIKERKGKREKEEEEEEKLMSICRHVCIPIMRDKI